MSFIIENNVTISFADYDDCVDKDKRLFEQNEGLTDDYVEEQLIRATERILSKLRSSSWWRSYFVAKDTSGTVINTAADIPVLDPNKIKARLNDFRDLCVYTAFSDFVLPSIADFSNEENAERNKMGYYSNKADSLFGELITAGDWYDFDNDGSIVSKEKQPGQYNLKRVR